MKNEPLDPKPIEPAEPAPAAKAATHTPRKKKTASKPRRAEAPAEGCGNKPAARTVGRSGWPVRVPRAASETTGTEYRPAGAVLRYSPRGDLLVDRLRDGRCVHRAHRPSARPGWSA